MRSTLVFLIILSLSTSWAATPTPNAKVKHKSALTKLFQKKQPVTSTIIRNEKVTVSGNETLVESSRASTVVKSPPQPVIVPARNSKPSIIEPITVDKIKPIVKPAQEKIVIKVAQKPKPQITLNQSETDIAHLLNVVDKMTPRQATDLSIKLTAKMFQPVPECLWNNMVAVGGLDIVVPGAAKFNNVYAPTFGNIGLLIGFNGGAMWALDDKWRVGFVVSKADTSIFKKTAATVYEDLKVEATSIMARVETDVIHEKGFRLTTHAALGYELGSFAYTSTNETTQTTFTKLRQGGNFMAQVGLKTLWELSPVWSWNAGLSYQMANITDMRRANVTDATSPELDLSGIIINIGTTFWF